MDLNFSLCLHAANKKLAASRIINTIEPQQYVQLVKKAREDIFLTIQ
jgi:hypothetical protein